MRLICKLFGHRFWLHFRPCVAIVDGEFVEYGERPVYKCSLCKMEKEIDL